MQWLTGVIYTPRRYYCQPDQKRTFIVFKCTINLIYVKLYNLKSLYSVREQNELFNTIYEKSMKRKSAITHTRNSNQLHSILYTTIVYSEYSNNYFTPIPLFCETYLKSQQLTK